MCQQTVYLKITDTTSKCKTSNIKKNNSNISTSNKLTIMILIIINTVLLNFREKNGKIFGEVI